MNSPTSIRSHMGGLAPPGNFRRSAGVTDHFTMAHQEVAERNRRSASSSVSYVRCISLYCHLDIPRDEERLREIVFMQVGTGWGGGYYLSRIKDRLLKNLSKDL